MTLFAWLDTPTLLIFLITLLIGFYFLSGRPQGLPPGPRPWPLVGNFPLIGKRPHKIHLLMHELYQKYGSVYTLWFGPFCTIVISDFQTIKKALVQQSELFSDRPVWMYLIQKFTYRIGIVMDHGQSWKEKRRFSLTALRDFGVGKRSIEEKIQEEADSMCREMAKSSGKPFSVNVLFGQAVSNIICSVCFGQRFAYDDKEFQEALTTFDEAFKMNIFSMPINFYPMLRFIPGDLFGLGRVESVYNKMIEFVNKQFEKHKTTFDPDNIRDYVDLCLLKESEGSFNRSDMVKAAVDLFAAGSETTSTSLRWMILYLIKVPDIQQKCQKEVDRVIGSSRTAAMSDRVGMPYVDATIHELLRHANITPMALPHDVRDETTLNGYKIPSHTMVFVNMYSVHMNPEHWEDPQEFRPERWISEDGAVMKKEAFIPFSIGPRICPGESLAKNELFIFFCTLLQRFHFRAHNEADLPSLEGDVGLTLSPRDYLVVPETRWGD